MLVEAVPLLVRGVGPVDVLAVSGLPQRDDHRMVTRVVPERLRR